MAKTRALESGKFHRLGISSEQLVRLPTRSETIGIGTLFKLNVYSCFHVVIINLRCKSNYKDTETLYLGPVHTNPFSNENRAVLLRFQKKICVHTYRFRPFTLQRRIRFKNALYPQCACSNELDACAFQYIGPRNWCKIKAIW